MFRKLLLLALTAAYAWVIWRMTLTPQVFTHAQNSLVLHAIAWVQQLPHGAWFTYERTEFLANIAMFVPVGALAALWLPRRWWILGAMVAVALSVGIELAQAEYLPYRVADPGTSCRTASAACSGRRWSDCSGACSRSLVVAACAPARPETLVGFSGCRRTAADKERSCSRHGHRATDRSDQEQERGSHGT
jgi:hypothetical protein